MKLSRKLTVDDLKKYLAWSCALGTIIEVKTNWTNKKRVRILKQNLQFEFYEHQNSKK